MTKEEAEGLVEKVRDVTVRSLERQLEEVREYTEILRSEVVTLTARNEELRFALSCFRGKE